MTLVTLKAPYMLQDNIIETVEVAPLMFTTFVRMAKKVVQDVTPVSRYETLLQRERIMTQCVFLTKDKVAVRIAADELFRMPASVAKQLVPALAIQEGKAGAIIMEGDGVSSPVVYKLGTPIKGAKDAVIEEIELIASTYGDLEDILSGDTALYQTVDLITKIAKPVGGTLMSLPSWALDQISVADGIMISNKVLPRFLE